MTAERTREDSGISECSASAGGMEDGLFSRVSGVIASELRPNVKDIDLGGFYPEDFMRRLGDTGAYAQSTPESLGGAGAGVGETIRVIEEVSKTCMSTGFCVWCQTVLGWYVQNGRSDFLKREILPEVITGSSLAGTGLSNPMKHFAGIERIKIEATPTDGGYILNGSIPWVSNVGESHYFAIMANCEETYIMAVIRGSEPGVTLGDGGHFIALEGSSTMSVKLKDVFVPNENILADPAGPYVEKIRPGFVLTQTGFGLGVIASCIALMRKANSGSRGDVNSYLEDGPEGLESEYLDLRGRIFSVADEISCGEGDGVMTRPELFREAVAARLATSELALRASQAAMLHHGAAGYRTGAATERKLRESYFVAIVTPATKHLRKLLYKLDGESRKGRQA